MQFSRYSSSIAAGTAGFFAGLFYHNFHCKRFLKIKAAKPVAVEINELISKEIEMGVTKLAPIMKYGFPSYDTLRTNDHFTLSYDRRNKIPLWVMEHLTSDMISQADEAEASREQSKFSEDASIHSYFRSTINDYRGSGYDKGHLAAVANYKYSQEALDSTFILSNAAPQNKTMNRGIWKKLEERVRKLTMTYKNVYVCSGPLFLPREIQPDDEELARLLQRQTGRKRKRRKMDDKEAGDSVTKKFVLYEVIGTNNVAVPTHFFKIIISEVENEVYDMEAYIIPNHPEPKKRLEDYMVPRNAIERAAGFLLFQNLPADNIRRINGKENIPMDLSLEDA